jgi:hypothetical protein
MTLKTFPLQNSTILLVVLSGLLLFYLIPIVLLLFILVSAFHFGDQQGLYLDFKFQNSY